MTEEAAAEQHAVQIPNEGEDNFIVDEAVDEVLRLHLDKFQGPFEVLLYLIKVQEIDIFDIPIVKITEQYLQFLGVLRERSGESVSIEVVGEFLVMAATLIQIKSKMLLPPESDDDDEDIEEEDPRLELVEKLLEYRKYQAVIQVLQELEEARAGLFARNTRPPIEPGDEEEEYLEVSLYDLIQAFKGVLRFISDGLAHTVAGEGYSVDDKIGRIQDLLAERKSVAWTDLLGECTSRMELVCCFLAILELSRMGSVRAHQHALFGDIRLFAAVEGAAD